MRDYLASTLLSHNLADVDALALLGGTLRLILVVVERLISIVLLLLAAYRLADVDFLACAAC